MTETILNIVLPTKNEQDSIKTVIDNLRTTIAESNYSIGKIVVVDDSDDHTKEIAKSIGCDVVDGENKGLGFAMIKGLRCAAEDPCDFIVSMDSDGQCDADEIPMFIEAITKANADLVLGSRFLGKKLIDYNYPKINRVGVYFLSKIIKFASGIPVTDSHGGIRALKPELASQLSIIGKHTYVQETIIDATEKGFRVIEIPSKWIERSGGKSRVVASIPRYVKKTLPALLLRMNLHLIVLPLLSLAFITLSQLLMENPNVGKWGNISGSPLIFAVISFLFITSAVFFDFYKRLHLKPIRQ